MIQVEKLEGDVYMNDERVIRRGEIYYIDIPKDENDPHKQTGCRPCIIWSNDSNNRYCKRVHYIPLTSQIKKEDLPVHVVLKSTRLPVASMALCESLEAIDKSHIKEKIGTVSEEDMFEIELATLRQQGMSVFLLTKKMRQYAIA